MSVTVAGAGVGLSHTGVSEQASLSPSHTVTGVVPADVSHTGGVTGAVPASVSHTGGVIGEVPACVSHTGGVMGWSLLVSVTPGV